MKVTDEGKARKVLWRLYLNHDAFIRRLAWSWSAEIVEPGQIGPPYRTRIVAEAATMTELLARLQELR